MIILDRSLASFRRKMAEHGGKVNEGFRQIHGQHQPTPVNEDYRKAFDSSPGKIATVAIMTDTDNTATKTTAYYGDIRLSSR